MKFPIFLLITRTYNITTCLFTSDPSLHDILSASAHLHLHNDDDDVPYHNGSIRLAARFKSKTNMNSFIHLKHTQDRKKQGFLGNASELLPCK
jgi:hypothetical protein